MPRGGWRPGSGRPKGALNEATRELHRLLETAPGAHRAEKLAAVAEDVTAAIEVRFAALRHLTDELYGRDRTGFDQPWVGRPAGCERKRTYRDTVQRTGNILDADITNQLAAVAEDEQAPLLTRMNALRYLAGALYGRIRLKGGTNDLVNIPTA